MFAGLPAIVGLYASTVPSLVYSFFGTSKEMVYGPIAIVSLIVERGTCAPPLHWDPLPSFGLSTLSIHHHGWMDGRDGAGLSPLAEPGTQEYTEKVYFMSFLVGIIFIIMGLLRLGFVVNFFSKPGIPHLCDSSLPRCTVVVVCLSHARALAQC
jgi:SulP family sulfate permease